MTIVAPVDGDPLDPAWGEDITAQVNADATSVAAILAAMNWQTWSPVLSGITLGSGGSSSARYRQFGKTIHWRFKAVLGTGGSVSTNPSITLPAAAHASYTAQDFLTDGGAIFDASAGSWMPAGLLNDSTKRIVYWPATNLLAVITPTVPWTWAVGDWMSVWGTYEAA